jgi:hypothetical protein
MLDTLSQISGRPAFHKQVDRTLLVTLTALAERTRFTIYTHLAQTGIAPSAADLAQAVGATSEELAEAMAELADSHHVVLNNGRIVLAHPFATRSFGFSVMGPHTLWWGGCAWDAFAIPNLVLAAPAALVATTCPSCDTSHAWTVTNEGPPPGDQVAHFLVPTDRIWPDAEHACKNQRIFCSHACVNDWLERTGNQRGYVLSLSVLWRLAAHWYDGRLDSPYQRREPALAAEYFRSVGLSGQFWGLPDDCTNDGLGHHYSVGDCM